MTECLARGRTLPEAYHNSLKALEKDGAVIPCTDYNTMQKEVSMTICVDEPLSEPMISRLFIGGPHELEQYRQEMLDGILDFEVERGNWEYTYHMRMEEQFDFILRELKRNPESRRAVIDIRDWRADSRKDSPACLQHIQYFIRDGALHGKVLFRSNDAVKATFMNAFALIMAPCNATRRDRQEGQQEDSASFHSCKVRKILPFCKNRASIDRNGNLFRVL